MTRLDTDRIEVDTSTPLGRMTQAYPQTAQIGRASCRERV